MIGLVKQNIEFTLKKDRFLHCLKTKQPLNDHAANGCLEPKLQNAALCLSSCNAPKADFRSRARCYIHLFLQPYLAEL
jgi:hypothetical protein